MPGKFHVLAPPGFQRDVRRLTARNPDLGDAVEELIEILEEDPHNQTGKYNIKKLVGVKPGDGQWRIRLGNYRLRYDIVGTDVVLDSFRDRKDAY